jgi:ribonuclease HI
MDENTIVIYTDGSCNPKFGVGAWAAMLLIDDRKFVLTGVEEQTTHQRMELQAVIKSFEYLAGENYGQNLLEIYTDSQYVVGIPGRSTKLKKFGFRTSKDRPIQNADLVQKLIGHLEMTNVKFVKVKAHLKGGHDWNREVDRVARKMVREMVEGRNDQ